MVFLGQKPETGLAWFFYGLARVFFGSVRFFRFQDYKTETELVGFFKILIGLISFFSRFSFFGFLRLISFSVFLLTPNKLCLKHVFVLKTKLKEGGKEE